MTATAEPPVVLFQFDDVPATVYTGAYPALAAAGFPATAYTATVNAESGGGYMSLAQCQEVYAAGWDIGCHTTNHAHLATLTEAQQEAEIGDCIAYLEANGMPRGAKHVAYPYGEYNADTLTAMAAVGARTGRLVNSNPQPTQLLTPYEIKGVCSLYTTSMPLADAKAKVDAATGTDVVIYLCHGLTDEGGDNRYAVADFAALVAYVKAQGCRVVTISQLWDYVQAGYVWP